MLMCTLLPARVKAVTTITLCGLGHKQAVIQRKQLKDAHLLDPNAVLPSQVSKPANPPGPCDRRSR